MDQMKENVDVRGNTIYFSGSHKSHKRFRWG